MLVCLYSIVNIKKDCASALMAEKFMSDFLIFFIQENIMQQEDLIWHRVQFILKRTYMQLSNGKQVNIVL